MAIILLGIAGDGNLASRLTEALIAPGQPTVTRPASATTSVAPTPAPRVSGAPARVYRLDMASGLDIAVAPLLPATLLSR